MEFDWPVKNYWITEVKKDQFPCRIFMGPRTSGRQLLIKAVDPLCHADEARVATPIQGGRFKANRKLEIVHLVRQYCKLYSLDQQRAWAKFRNQLNSNHWREM